MARDEYIPVTGDDWYQRRRDDAEGRFFRKVADQGPRKGQGGSTRQGIYIFTADGQLLAYRNAGQNPDVMRQVLRQGLDAWQKLPADRRRPGAVTVEDAGPPDRRYTRTPPPNGLIVKVYTRALDRDAEGRLCDADCKRGSGDESARDHLWLTEAEWRSLVPANPTAGVQFAVPAKIADRLLRFHLVDNTRGEPPHWRGHEVRARELTLTVESADANHVTLRLDGRALLATDADPAKADRGFDVCLLGYLRYDVRRRAFDRFDIVAVGEHWGHGPYTRGARPGRTPLGVAFELTTGDRPADRIPPQAARTPAEYFGGAP